MTSGIRRAALGTGYCIEPQVLHSSKVRRRRVLVGPVRTSTVQIWVCAGPHIFVGPMAAWLSPAAQRSRRTKRLRSANSIFACQCLSSRRCGHGINNAAPGRFLERTGSCLRSGSRPSGEHQIRCTRGRNEPVARLPFEFGGGGVQKSTTGFDARPAFALDLSSEWLDAPSRKRNRAMRCLRPAS